MLLVAPDVRYRASFLEALGEYHAEGMHTDLSPPADFERWLAAVREAGQRGEGPIERDRVPHRILWWVAGGEYLGRVRINLELNAQLTDFGGHIGYDIRPSARGRGQATALLGQALRTAGTFGIDPALLTCDQDNHASRKVIERNGGVFTDVSPAGRLRYRCRTGRC